MPFWNWDTRLLGNPPVILLLNFGHIERFGGRLKPFTEYLAKIVSEG